MSEEAHDFTITRQVELARPPGTIESIKPLRRLIEAHRGMDGVPVSDSIGVVVFQTRRVVIGP